MSDQQLENQTHEQTQVSPLSEIQMKLAIARPRDAKLAVARALEELALFPEFAAKAYYSIPYKDNRQGRTTFVEGVGVRGASSMLRFWGNCISASQVGDERKDRILCQGLYFDYETGALIRLEVGVARFYRSKEGRVLPRNANEMQLAIQSGLSKARRNAALEGMPVAFREMYFAEAKRIVALPRPGARQVSIQERIAEGRTKLAEKYGATDEELGAILTAAVAEADGDWDYAKELALWIGIWNGLKENNNPDVVFGRITAKQDGAGMPRSTDEVDAGAAE